jgi:5-formyltetrahydrofolate cyclo-ligase
LKKTIRVEALALRAQLKPDDVTTWSAQIAERVQGLEKFRRAKVIALYLAMPGEAQTAPILAACHRLGQRVCVPAFDNRAGCYRLAWLTANDILAVGHWQIPEPAEPVWVAQPETVDVVLVPGLAFDAACHRLGHGRGWLDRLLEGLSAYKIGLGFAEQIMARVPVLAHDVLMDAVVTEKEVYLRA